MTVGLRNEKRQDIDFYYYIIIDNQEIEVNTQNQEILYNLLKRKEVV